jgi:hypothetical protein
MYAFTVCLIPKIGKFPRDLRLTLGEKIDGRTLMIFEHLIQARFRTEKRDLLEAANVDLEVLCYLIRPHALPPAKFAAATERDLHGKDAATEERQSPHCRLD